MRWGATVSVEVSKLVAPEVYRRLEHNPQYHLIGRTRRSAPVELWYFRSDEFPAVWNLHTLAIIMFSDDLALCFEHPA